MGSLQVLRVDAFETKHVQNGVVREVERRHERIRVALDGGGGLELAGSSAEP